MIRKKLLVLASCLFAPFCFSQSDSDTTHHEINYGIIDFDSLSFVDMDFSEIPVLGVRYNYYFDSLKDVDAPYAIAADVARISWIDLELNLLTEISPNIGGHFYLNDQWSLEADFIYDRNSYSSNSTSQKEDNIYVDVVANYTLNDNWQLGFGVRNFTEFSEYRDDFNDLSNYDSTDSDSNIVMQSRYTNIINNQGWDVASSVSSSSDINTFKVRATHYTSKQNGLTFGMVHVNENGDSDSFTAVSFGHEYWTSDTVSIDYGVGFGIGDSSFVLVDINAKWRF
jgi:hypothetical protein